MKSQNPVQTQNPNNESMREEVAKRMMTDYVVRDKGVSNCSFVRKECAGKKQFSAPSPLLDIMVLTDTFWWQSLKKILNFNIKMI